MLKAGFGRSDITPGPGVALGGYAVPGRVSEEVFDPLHATAALLSDGRTEVLLIGLDWLSVDAAVTGRIRAEVSRRTGIAPEAVQVTASHTHSAPNTLDFRCFGVMALEYIDSAIPRIAEAAERAAAGCREARAGVAETVSRAGVNRRAVSAFHDTRFEADPHGALDDAMTAVEFRHGDQTAGVIIHYGAHATAMGVNGLVSRDWPGVMKDRVESQFHAPVLFLNGALGDVGPRVNCRAGARGLSAGTGDGPDAVREVGYRAASDAVEALLSIREYRDLPLEVRHRAIELPCRPLPPPEEARKLVDAGGDPARVAYGEMVLEAYRRPPRDTAAAVATAVILGPLALLMLPGEVFADISLRLRRRSPYRHTLVCSIANANLGYLVTREARHRGGYEIEAAMYAAAHILADHTDDLLVEHYTGLLTTQQGD